MSGYEYKVVPAPTKGRKAKGVKTAEARFAFALEELMNQMGADGWEYQRADTLPSVERSGLTGSTTNWRHVLVFRRALDMAAAEPLSEAAAPEVAPKPAETPEELQSAAVQSLRAVPPPQSDEKPEPPLTARDQDTEEAPTDLSASLENLDDFRKKSEKSDT